MRSLISISLFFIKSKAQVCGYGFLIFCLTFRIVHWMVKPRRPNDTHLKTEFKRRMDVRKWCYRNTRSSKLGSK